MNRREFIKNMAIAAGGVAGAAILGGSVLTAAETSSGKGKKKMKQIAPKRGVKYL